MTSGGSPMSLRVNRSLSTEIPHPSPSIPIEKFSPRGSFSITGSFSSTGSTPSSGSFSSPRAPTQEYQFVDKLKVTVAEAKNLAPKDKNGVSSDPFVVIKIRKKEEKTKVAHNTLNPVWNADQTCFVFELDEDDLANDTKMKFTVWDKNKMSNDYMGETSINITSLIKKKEKVVDKWYPLESNPEKGKDQIVSGEIRIILELIYSTVETEDLDILSSSGRAKFFQRFPSVPSSQKIQVVFNCALSQKKIPVQGVMYILDNFVCFYSNLLGKKKKVIIDFQQIDSIEKKFPNAIEISVKDTKKYFFESFIHRNRAYESLLNQSGYKPENSTPMPGSSPTEPPPNLPTRNTSKSNFDKNRIIMQSVDPSKNDKESGHRHRRSSSLDTKEIDKAIAEASPEKDKEQVMKTQDLHLDPRISSSPSPFPVSQPVFKSPSASHRRGKSVQIVPHEPSHLIPPLTASHHTININIKVKQYKELKSEKNLIVTISPSKPVQSLLNQLGQQVRVNDVSEFTLYVVDSKKNKQPMDPVNFIYNYNIGENDHVTFARKKKSGIAQYLHAIRNNEDTQNQILLNVDIVDYEKLKVKPKTTIVLEGDLMISQVISKIVSEGNVHIPEKKLPEYTLCIMKSPDRGIIPDDTSQFISLYGLQDKDTIKLVKVFPIKSIYEKFNVKSDRSNRELAFELSAHCVLFPLPDSKSGNSSENPDNKNSTDNNNTSASAENPPKTHRKTHSRVGSLSKKNTEEIVPESSSSNPSISAEANNNHLEYEQQQKLLKMLSQYLGLDSKTSQQIIGVVSKLKEAYGNSAEIFLVELFYRLLLIDSHPFYKQQIFQNAHHFIAWRTREIDAITKGIRSIIFNPATFVGVLNINVLSCKNIAPQNKGGTADTYCVLRIDHDKQNAKTKIQRKQLHPTFNEHFKFTVTHPHTSLNVLLIDKDQNIGMSNDSTIGEVNIPLLDLHNGNMVDNWFSFNTAGKIHLQLQLCFSHAKYVRSLESILETLKTNTPQVPMPVSGSAYSKLSVSTPRLPTQKLSSSFSDIRRERDFPLAREQPVITLSDENIKPRSPERVSSIQRNLTQPVAPSSPSNSRSSSPNFESPKMDQPFPPLQPNLDDLVNAHFLYKIMMKKILFSADTINLVKKDRSEIFHKLLQWLIENFEKRFGIHKEFRNVIILYYIDGILQPLPNQLVILSDILTAINQFRPLATKIEHEMIDTGLKAIRKSLHQFVTHYIKYFPKNIPENGLSLSIQCLNLLQNYHTSNVATNLVILKQHYGGVQNKEGAVPTAVVSPKLQGLLIECLQDAIYQIYHSLRHHVIEEHSEHVHSTTGSHHSGTGSVHSFVNNDDDVIVNNDDDENQTRSDSEQTPPEAKPEKAILSLAELCGLCDQISVDIDQQNFFKDTFAKWGVNFEQEVGNRYYTLLMEDVKQFCEHTDYASTAVATLTTSPIEDIGPLNVFDLYFKVLSLVDDEDSPYFSNVAERQNLMDMFTIFVYGWMKQMKTDLRNITEQAKDSKGVGLSLALSPVNSSKLNQQLTTEALSSIFKCYTSQFEFFRSLRVNKPFMVIQFAEILCDVAPKFVNLTFDRAMEEILEQGHSNKNFSVSKMICFSLNDIHEASNRLKFLKSNLSGIFEKALTAEAKAKHTPSELSKDKNGQQQDEFSVTLRESFHQCFDHAFAVMASKLQTVITTISTKLNLQLNQLLLQGVSGMTPQSPTINVKVIKEYIDTQLVSLNSYLYPDLFKLILSKVWEDILQDLENLLLSTDTTPVAHPTANGTSLVPTGPIPTLTPFQVKGLLPLIEDLSAFFYVSGKGLSKQFVDTSTEFLRKILELWLQTTSSLIDLWFKLPYLPSETKAKVMEASNNNTAPAQKTVNKNHVYILIHYRTRNSVGTSDLDKEAKAFCLEQNLIKENKDIDKIAWMERVRVHFRLQPSEMILEHYPQAAVSIRENEKSEDKTKHTGFVVLTSTHFCFDTKMEVPSSQKEKGFIESFIDQKMGGTANLKIALALKDIMSLEKKTKSYFWDSIRITTKNGKVYHFDGFPNRDVAWKDIVDQLIAVGNSQFKIIQ